MNRRGPSLFTIIYVVIGIIVAASDEKDYFKLNDIEAVLSMILAVLLWPLLLFDVNLMIK